MSNAQTAGPFARPFNGCDSRAVSRSGNLSGWFPATSCRRYCLQAVSRQQKPHCTGHINRGSSQRSRSTPAKLAYRREPRPVDTRHRVLGSRGLQPRKRATDRSTTATMSATEAARLHSNTPDAGARTEGRVTPGRYHQPHRTGCGAAPPTWNPGLSARRRVTQSSAPSSCRHAMRWVPFSVAIFRLPRWHSGDLTLQ